MASIYLVVLFARVILDWVRFFRPLWRPSGVLLPVANLTYVLTDPPLRLMRRYIPPLRLGQGFAFDVGFMIVFLCVILLQRCGLWLQSLGVSLI
ncbi:YggT family protein [Schaalia suimastitidis]|uniref:YggT family protein n=1 Tax=Schaalia suimastitidis TaxID=121163 RepID=UPI003083F6AF